MGVNRSVVCEFVCVVDIRFVICVRFMVGLLKSVRLIWVVSCWVVVFVSGVCVLMVVRVYVC